MAEHAMTLTAEQEVALLALVESWLESQPATAWTSDLVLERMVFSALETRLRELDVSLQSLLDVARQLDAPGQAELLAAMSGAANTRLQQLLA